LAKDGARACGVWSHLENLTDRFVANPLLTDDVSAWFKGVLQSYMDKMEVVVMGLLVAL
jgi:hypothetical protein